MKKTWAILSDILNRKAINPLPDMMTIQGQARQTRPNSGGVAEGHPRFDKGGLQ